MRPYHRLNLDTVINMHGERESAGGVGVGVGVGVGRGVVGEGRQGGPGGNSLA